MPEGEKLELELGLWLVWALLENGKRLWGTEEEGMGLVLCHALMLELELWGGAGRQDLQLGLELGIEMEQGAGEDK